MTKEMVFVSFASLDRDELRRFGPDSREIGTTKRTHRKSVFMSYDRMSQDEKLIMIDTPGVRSESKERYMGIFEGDIGVCMINIADLENYISFSANVTSSSPDDDDFVIKLRNLDRRLFDPIRFWCAYKRIQDLVIAVSKIDLVDFDVERIRRAVGLVYKKLDEYGLDISKVPVIPISVRVRLDGDIIRRETYNVDRPNIYMDEYETALLPEVEKRGLTSNSDLDAELLASISQLCKIKNESGYAFRTKILRSTLTPMSQIVIGPLKHIKSNSLQYVTGQIKSLKDESTGCLTSSLPTGCIGGVCFSHVYDSSYRVQPPSSKLIPIEEFKVLRTTVMVSKSFVTGNAVSLRVPEDELGESSLMAMNQLLPKESLGFFWFGKRSVADVVELYHSQNSWYITLCPLTKSYQNASGEFTVPSDYADKFHTLETLVIVQLVQKENKSLRSYSNYINFSVTDLSTVSFKENHNVKLQIDSEDFDYLCEDFNLRFESLPGDLSLDFSPFDRTISISNVSFDVIGQVLKVIRQFIRENGFTGFNLTLDK